MGVDEHDFVGERAGLKRTGAVDRAAGRGGRASDADRRVAVIGGGKGVRSVAQHAALDDGGRIGQVPVGSERTLEGDVLRGLRHGPGPQRNRERREHRGLDLEVGVHAKTQQPLPRHRHQLVIGVGRENAVAGVKLLARRALDNE